MGDCEHKDVKLVKTIVDDGRCISCKQPLVANEIEILGMFYEVGGFCSEEKCERYMLLVA